MIGGFVFWFGFSLLSFFFFLNYFFIIFKIIFIFYFNNFILFEFFFHSFFFSPFSSGPCGWKGLVALTRCQICTSEVGDPSSGYWSTRDLLEPCNIKWRKSPRDIHLNVNTQLHSTISNLQCCTPYAKQLARQERNTIH